MLEVVISIILTCILFLFGSIAQMIGKLFNALCYLFSLITKGAVRTNTTIKTSKEFRGVINVNKVKRSNKNIKHKSSIHICSLIILLISFILLVMNSFTFGLWEPKIINNLLYQILKWLPFITQPADVQSILTAVLFTLMSFSLSTMWLRWKETKDIRKERKLEKAKKLVLSNVSSKQLIDDINKQEEKKKQEIIND